MTRFYAFGCSYTYYSWPTWADLVGMDYQHYENWGIPGLGNRAIFERLVECHAKNRFSENDLIIVQWSSHLRFDWLTQHSLKDRTSRWRTGGSIFTAQNQDIFDRHWQHLFFDEFAYVMHSLNYISAAQNLLENTGCQWYMTSIGDIRKLGFDLLGDEDYGEKITDQNWDRFPELHFFEDAIWSNHRDRWLEPIQTCCKPYKDRFYRFIDSKQTPIFDYHPSPWLFNRWIEKNLQNKGINTDSVAIELIVNSVEKLYDNVGLNKIRHDFDHRLQNGDFSKPEKMSWPNTYKGIH